ncbi:MAG: hypothetical protein FJX47_01700 [Alphaproteobacteria bacterium]|nr:hypothetical protein [Alphaproteobacteria bacterium]
MAVPVIDLGDDPQERGLAHGRRFAKEIRDNIDIYLARFGIAGLDAPEARRRGGEWAKRITAFDAEYGAEMVGIAEGAGLPVGDIAMLNARYELAYGAFGDEDGTRKPTPDGCTTFAALPERTRSGEILIGQNWDWLEGLIGRVAVLRVKRKAKPSFVCLTQAGIAGGMIGVNDRGIGLCVNGLTTPEDGRNTEAKPFHLRVRDVLSAKTLAAALLPVTSSKRTCSTHFLIAHEDGDAIAIEAAPDRANYLNPVDGFYVHANHFVGPTTGDGFEAQHPSTLYRAQRLERRLRQSNRPIDLGTMHELLSDHSSHPNSICAHPDPDVPEAKRTATIASVVIALKSRTLYLTDGPPCRSEYVAYPLAA